MKVDTQKIEKVVVNAGIGRIAAQPNFDKVLPEIIKDFSMITGQKPATRPAKQSISGFKIREGAIVGLKTTLRGGRMVQFLEKLNRVVLPRIRDFRGLETKSVDAGGNLSLGIRENAAFPEISQEISKINFGIEVTIVPKRVKNREEAIKMYREMGVPLKKSEARNPQPRLAEARRAKSETNFKS